MQSRLMLIICWGNRSYIFGMRTVPSLEAEPQLEVELKKAKNKT